MIDTRSAMIKEKGNLKMKHEEMEKDDRLIVHTCYSPITETYFYFNYTYYCPNIMKYLYWVVF